MTDSVTLLTLRTGTRQRADMVGSQFVTDSELNGYIVNSYKELYDLLVDAVEDYNLSTSSITISTGNTMSLPATFYKLRGIDDMTDSANPRTVRKFLFGERNDYLFSERMYWSQEFSDVMYRIEGANIAIVPATKAARPYQIWYVPTPTVPSADNDAIDVINGFDEYIIVDAAIKCLTKEESDTSKLEKAKGNLTDRIERMKSNRDQNLPEKITRVRNRRRSGMYPYMGDFTP